MRVTITGDVPEQSKNLQKDESIQQKRKFYKWKSFPNSNKSNKGLRTKKWNRDIYSDVLELEKPLPKPDEEEAIGIITLEDVIEELLQVNKSHFRLTF